MKIIEGHATKLVGENGEVIANLVEFNLEEWDKCISNESLKEDDPKYFKKLTGKIKNGELAYYGLELQGQDFSGILKTRKHTRGEFTAETLEDAIEIYNLSLKDFSILECADTELEEMLKEFACKNIAFFRYEFSDQFIETLIEENKGDAKDFYKSSVEELKGLQHSVDDCLDHINSKGRAIIGDYWDLLSVSDDFESAEKKLKQIGAKYEDY